METAFSLIFFVLTLGIIIGMFKPKLVIRWGNKKNRKQVLKYYGMMLIIITVMSSMIIDVNDPKTLLNEAREHVEQKEYGRALNNYEKIIENWDEEKIKSVALEEIKKEYNQEKDNYLKYNMSNNIETAKKQVENNNYEKAVKTYNSILSNWDDSVNYNYKKTDIEKEFEKSKNKYIDIKSDEIINAIDKLNLEEAINLSEETLEIIPDNENISYLYKQAKSLKNKIDKEMPDNNWKGVIGAIILEDTYTEISFELKYFEDTRQALGYYFKKNIENFLIWSKSYIRFKTKEFYNDLWGRKLSNDRKIISFIYREKEPQSAPEQYKKFMKENDIKPIYMNNYEE